MIFLCSRDLQWTINLGGDEELVSDPALLSPFAYNLFGRFILAEINREFWKDTKNDMAY